MNSAQSTSGSSGIHVPNLLLVEDSLDDVVITQRALARAHIGNHLTVANDGQQALDLLYADAMDGRERFGLVLLDLGLPRVDGREVLKRIWGDRRLRQIPVIVLTGSDEDEDMVRSYKSGAVAFLRKPVQVERLLHTVGDLRGYQLLITRVQE